MRPLGAADGTGKPAHDRGAFIVWRVGHGPARLAGFGFFPSALEFLDVAVRAVTIEEIPVGLNARKNEIPGRLPEDRLPLLRVSIEQRLASPAVQARGKLPTEIDDVIEPVVE